MGGKGNQQGLRWTLSRIYYKGTTDFSLRCFKLHDRLKNQDTIKSNFGGIQHSQKTSVHILCICWTQAGTDFLEACLPATWRLKDKSRNNKGQPISRGIIKKQDKFTIPVSAVISKPQIDTRSMKMRLLNIILKVSVVMLRQLQDIKARPFLPSVAKVRIAQIPRLNIKPF